jgi:hypothetical protein
MTAALQIGHRFSMGHWQGEPISWRVLAVEKHRALVISDCVLDYEPFHTWSAVIWKDSLARVWAMDFYDEAFSQEEKKRIRLTTIHTSDKPVWSDDTADEAGVKTRDRVFLLSMQEAQRYFAADEDRVAKATVYMQSKYGAKPDPDCICGWWLRNRGFNVSYASDVLPHGEIDDYGEEVYESGGMRPAMWINL